MPTCEHPTDSRSRTGPFAPLLRYFAIDDAVAFSLANNIWGVVSFPVTIYLVTTYFSRDVQGYYYTFSSLLLLQTVLELGFSTVLVQFISHEWSRLHMTESGEVGGDPRAAARLFSVFRLGMRWYAALAVAFSAIVGPAGLVFLLRHGSPEVDLARPWWLLCSSVSVSLLLIPLRSLLEGSNRIDRSQRIQTLSGIVSGVGGWVAIYHGAGLYALAVINSLYWATSLLMLLPTTRAFLRIGRTHPLDARVSWRREFWPQQWRIGVSWTSGYLMFASFVPFIYLFHGPAAAGLMGTTLSVYNTVNSFSMSWAYVKGPAMGILAAKGDFRGLRSLVGTTLRRCISAAVLFSAAALSVVALVKHFRIPQAERFAGLGSITLFLLGAIVLQVSHVETQAIRFQKKEPFVKVSIVSAVLVTLFNVLLGRRFGITGIGAGFAAVMAFYLIPACHIIYRDQMKDVG